jgi:hypothetical protein
MKIARKLDKRWGEVSFSQNYYKHKMAEYSYSVSSPMYSVEEDVVDIEENRAITDI